MPNNKAILLFFILFISIFNTVEFNFNICYGQSSDLYLITEIVEVTTNWTDVNWTNGFQVIASNHVILEGEEAIQELEIVGLEGA